MGLLFLGNSCSHLNGKSGSDDLNLKNLNLKLKVDLEHGSTKTDPKSMSKFAADLTDRIYNCQEVSHGIIYIKSTANNKMLFYIPELNKS